jgi:phage FluMu gp28-like protein
VDNALSIGFHKRPRTSYVHSLAASTGIRGGRKEVVMDELAHIPEAEDLFRAALPAIMNGDLGMDLMSTPRGKHNFFGEMWLNEPNERGKRPYDHFSRHKFIWVDVERFLKSDTFQEARIRWYQDYDEDMSRMQDLVDEFGNEKILHIRDMYPWEYFLQEFCGHFIDDTHSIFSWDLIDSCLKGSLGVADDVTEDFLEPWSSRPEDNNNRVILGVDFGKSGESNDKTSIQIIEKAADGKIKHRYSRNLSRNEFNDFPAQAEEVARIAMQFRVNQLVGDNTGFGSAVLALVKRHIPAVPIEAVDFNNENKEQMVMNLKVLMEQHELWLLFDEKQLHAEIHGMEGTQLPSGKVRYHGEPHDDMFWALALAAKEGTYKHFAMYTIDSLRAQMN